MAGSACGALVGSGLDSRAGVAFYPSGVVSYVHKVVGSPVSGGGLRSGVSTFSPASRRRLRKRVVRMDWGRAIAERRLLWCCITARSGSVVDFKAGLDNWRRWMFRAYPGSWFVWRMEFQARGVAHFHLLVYSPAGRVAIPHLRAEWLRLIGDAEQQSQSFALARSLARIANYVSDVGKVSQTVLPVDEVTGEIECPGRWWGVRSDTYCVDGEVRRCSDLFECWPCVVNGFDAFFEYRRFISRLRRSRLRQSRKYQGRDGPVALRRCIDCVEFVDGDKVYASGVLGGVSLDTRQL